MLAAALIALTGAWVASLSRPHLSIRVPKPNSTVSGAIQVEVSGSRDITRVAFILDGRLADVDRKPPFSLGRRSLFDTRTLANGRHVLEIQISRRGKTVVRRSRAFVVQNAPTQDVPPAPKSGVFVAPSGSDRAGSGTLDRPFKTVRRAALAARPGDTVWVRGGVYGPTRISCWGTRTAPITFKAYPGERAVFDGTGARLAATEALVTIDDSGYLAFEGFDVRNSSGRGIVVLDSSNVAVRQNTVHDTWAHAVMGSGDSLTFEGNQVFRGVLSNQNGAGSGYWAAVMSTWLKSNGTRSSNVTFRANRVFDSWGEGITALQVDNANVVGNSVSDVWSVALYLDNAADVRVENNVVNNSNPAFYRNWQPAAGVSLANEYYPNAEQRPVENITVAGNRITRSRWAVGYWHDYRRTVANTYRNVRIYDNYFKDTTAAPLFWEDVPAGQPQPSGNVARDNVVYPGGDGRTVVLGDPGAWLLANNAFPAG